MTFPKVLRAVVLSSFKKEFVNGSIVQKEILNVIDSEIAQLFCQGLRFTCKLLSAPDTLMGTLLPNGTWTGMIRMILYSDADIAVTKMTILEERLQAVPLSNAYASSYVTFTTQKPTYTPSVTAFLRPFALDVWMSVILCLVVMPLIFCMVLSKRHDVSRLTLLTFGTFIQQDFLVVPQRLSEYLISGFWLKAMVFLSSSYTALLLSFLTFPPLVGVRTITELTAAVSENKYECTSYLGATIPSVLSNSSDPVMRIIGQNLKNNPGSRDIEGVLINSKNSAKAAFVGVMQSFWPLKEKYFVSDDIFYYLHQGIPFRKDFCCKRKLNQIISYIQAGGTDSKDCFR